RRSSRTTRGPSLSADAQNVRAAQNRGMNELQNLSNQFADVVAAIAPSVVQVQRVSGVVYANDVVLTNARALGREDGLHVTTDDGRTLDAELHGWDPATGLALVRASGLNAPAAKQSKDVARVGNLAI